MSKEGHDTTQPVFRLKPTPYNNSCVIKHVGYLTEKEKLGDERVEFDTSVEMQNQYGKNIDYLGLIKQIEAYQLASGVFELSPLLHDHYLPSP